MFLRTAYASHFFLYCHDFVCEDMMHMKTNREGRGPVQPFSGGIADVRIWSSALPDAEMSSVYRQFVGDAVDPEGYVSGGFSHTVSYEQNRDLVSAVTNRFGSRVISAFGYSNGTAGRRTAISRSGEAFGDLSGAVDAYGYNLRSEVVSARRTKDGAPVRGFDEDFSYDPIGNRIATTNYTETGAAVVSEYAANNLNQYTSRTVPGVAAVRGFADANATVTVNENPTWRLGEYFFGSDEFDNSAAPVDAALVTTAALASPTNGPDEVASVTSRVHIATTPQLFEYDDDGNQTLVTTKTGTWRVKYNGENRPVRWERLNSSTPNSNTPSLITMTFDHQGRRRSYIETSAVGTTNRLDRFTYDNYLCIARNRWQPDGTSAADCFAWDPTEPVATRPLIFYHPNAPPQLYAIDGNKNISELVSSDDGTISAHYEYAPFGEVILSSGDFAVTNPFCFSSEYADDALALVYFNYRHLDTVTGRWQQRDQIEELGKLSLYGYVSNNSIKSSDVYGLFDDGYVEECVSGHWEISTTLHGSFMMWVCDVRVRKEADYKGHYQFTNNGTHCPFDYTKEDHDFGSSPFTPWGMWKHFRSAGDIIPELEEAISNCNAEKFQSLMHQLQDTRTHYDRNWRWWTLGHVFGGTSPDRDEYAQTTAWDLAEKDTKDFVEKWNSSCKLKDKCCCCIWERR